MEPHGSRAEMLARMRQARMEKVKAKMEEEGIEVPERESPHVSAKKSTTRNDRSKSQRREEEYIQERPASISPGVSREPRDRSKPRVQEEFYASTGVRGGSNTRFIETLEEDARRPLAVSPITVCPQVRFYESAIEGEKKKLLEENMVREYIKNQANSRKINKKSEQILRDKLFASLMEAVTSVCPTSEDTVTFEKLGRILYLMELFTHIQYDADCEVIVDMDLKDKADQLLRHDEVGIFELQMVFHDQLWGHLAFDGRVLAREVARDHTLLFLRALFDTSYSPKEHTEFLMSKSHADNRNIISGRVFRLHFENYSRGW
jgi:hypothetical protein